MPNIDTAKEQHPSSANNKTEAKEKFIRHIIHNNAPATHDIRSEKFDLEQQKKKVEMPCQQWVLMMAWKQCL
ncbi:MAG: hypothetical protein P4L79_15440 [Legionella sp.]|uniref:hypothetical protein n=1 Tax=Legionella sp. TaxID=459 RepID=UPI00284B5FAE|nr:hypothetical protein [Legionella sp.]